jgi:3-dehydroquinate synthase
MKHLLDVTPPSGPRYPVLYGSDAPPALATVWSDRWRRAAIIGDGTTMALFGAPIAMALRGLGCAPITIAFPPGEQHKTRATKDCIEDQLLAAGLDRHSCIVAVGGGIALDVAGFVAATYLRGIAHINVATTLLAQVDAAIGGKTGVNTEHGKNLIGAFHHPRAVLIDTGALASLPDVEMKNGLAEAVKHAALRDADLFARLETWARGAASLRPPDEVIARCVAIKAEVVAEDDTDRGVRNILNFGHTVAHAIEAATDHQTPHGHAVAIGMVIETRVGCTAGWSEAGAVDRLASLLDRLGLPTRPPCPFDAALEYFGRDKKTEAGVIHCAVPERIGALSGRDGFTRAVSVDALRGAWT